MIRARPLIDYSESVRDRLARERRKHIAARIRDIGAALLLIVIFSAALGLVLHFERTVSEYVALKEERVALRAKVADMQTWDCRDYRSGARDFKWCSRARRER